MPTIKIQYSDNDTTPERLEALATEQGVSVEHLVKRCIAQGLDDHGLRELTDADHEEAGSVKELFSKWGITKE